MDKASHERPTADYDERMDHQGQAAMDAAIAHPLVRFFFGIICVFGLIVLVEMIPEKLLGQDPVWRKLVYAIGLPLICGPMLFDLGSVAIFGRSRTPWYRAIMRRWRTRRRPG